eukprot:scaffold951_cov277-Chaetoceros_neogracile.AAC.2
MNENIKQNNQYRGREEGRDAYEQKEANEHAKATTHANSALRDASTATSVRMDTLSQARAKKQLMLGLILMHYIGSTCFLTCVSIEHQGMLKLNSCRKNRKSFIDPFPFQQSSLPLFKHFFFAFAH